MSIGGPAGVKVLLVDSDSASAQRTERHLLECEYTVTKCYSVTAAKKHLRRCCFDALMVEEKLVLNKSSCSRKPELLKVAGSTPVILIGSCIDTERSNSKIMRSIQLGVADYLHKPLCYESVWKIWQHCLRQRMRKARGEKLCVTQTGELRATPRGSEGEVQQNQRESTVTSHHDDPDKNTETNETARNSEALQYLQPEPAAVYVPGASNLQEQRSVYEPQRSNSTTPTFPDTPEPNQLEQPPAEIMASNAAVEDAWKAALKDIAPTTTKMSAGEDVSSLPLGISLAQTTSMDEIAAV